jgi:membrane dipeptidase
MATSWPSPTLPSHALLSERLLGALGLAFAIALLATVAAALLALRGLRRSPVRAASAAIALSIFLQLVFTRGPAALEWRVSHARAPLPERYMEMSALAPQNFVAADLHSDALFWWRRDLLARGVTGGVDVPRLREGAFAIQVFGIVVSVPRGLNVESNARPAGLLDDHVFTKALFERWPMAAWSSHLQRALVQCLRLHRVAAASDGQLRVARTSSDLTCSGSERGIAGLLALEGGSALEGNIENLNLLYAAGLRLLGPTHFFDTDVGGSQSGVEKGGLTPFGRSVVSRMKELGMIVDLAHSSDAIIEDLAEMPEDERPCVLLSHTGIRVVCESQRNIDDEHLRLMYVVLSYLTGEAQFRWTTTCAGIAL